MPPFGRGPDQQKLHNRGNAYIRSEFPLIDFIESCLIISSDDPNFNPNEMNQNKIEINDPLDNIIDIGEIKIPSSHTSLRQEVKPPQEIKEDIKPSSASNSISADQTTTTTTKTTTSLHSINSSALYAIIFLIVAIILFCLYQYKNSPISPKSL